MTVYGAPWCLDCGRSKQFLGDQRIPYEWVDIDQNENGCQYVQQGNDGKRIIPTIVFKDGSTLVKSSNADLAEKLGINPRASMPFYNLFVINGDPAGVTAAMYAPREGIGTLSIERSGIGARAGVPNASRTTRDSPKASEALSWRTRCVHTLSVSVPRSCRGGRLPTSAP